MSYHGYRRQTIQQKVADVLRAYRQEHPDRFRLPMDPVDIADFCGLGVSFEPMEDEIPGFRPLAKIVPAKRLIVVDEGNYRENPGQAHFSIGHEIGHWVLYLKKESVEGQSSLFVMSDAEAEGAGFYRTRQGWGLPSISNLAKLSDCALQAIAEFFKGIDTPAVERAVNSFSAFLLMPEELVRSMADQCGMTEAAEDDLPALVRHCAGICNVSVRAMGIRFTEVGVLYANTENGRTSYTRQNPRDRIQPALF